MLLQVTAQLSYKRVFKANEALSNRLAKGRHV